MFDDSDDEFYFAKLYSDIVFNIFKRLIPNRSFYIPSSRDELLKNRYNTLSKKLRGRFDFSLVQNELSVNLLDITPDSKKGEYYDLACKLEKDILNGEIGVEYIDSNVEFYFENIKNNIKISLDLSSSAIRELAPFILYLKFLLKRGDTLIIEEPEAHLHPKNQRKLVKYFVELYNQGLNIDFTTHSDYIVDQINNHIRLNNLSTEIINEKFDNFTKLDALNFNNFNIYDFKENTPFDFSIFKIKIYSTGFDEYNFEKVSSELYDETNKIIDAKGEW